MRRVPAIPLAAAVVVAIALADWLRPPAMVLVLLTAALFGGGALLLQTKQFRRATLLLVLSVGSFAGAHFGLRVYAAGIDHLSRVVREPLRCEIYARVTDWPVIRKGHTEIPLRADSLDTGIVLPVKGGLLLRLSDTTTVLQRGDRIVFNAVIYPVRLRDVADHTDYGRYLNRRGIHGVVYLTTLLDVRIDRSRRSAFLGVVDRLRGLVRDTYRFTLTSDGAALAAGFLIGETHDIPVAVYERFRDSGTLHLLAVSGSNVALVLASVLLLLRPAPLSLERRSYLLLAVIALFALLSYAEPSVVRASVMAALVIASRLVQRRVDLNQVIALAAVLILLVDPGQLFEIGFQLSFVIAWGLVFIVPKLTRPLHAYSARWWYRYLLFPLIIVIVAQFASAGLVGLYFGCIPLISPLANLVIVPLVSLAVPILLLVLAASVVTPILGQFVGSVVSLYLEGVIKLVEWFGQDGGPVWQTSQWTTAGVVAYYVLLVVAAVATSQRWARKVSLVIFLVAVNVWLSGKVWTSINRSPDPLIVAETLPGGALVLVDRQADDGPDLIVLSAEGRDYHLDEAIILPRLRREGISRIDKLIVLSAEYDALADLLTLTAKIPVADVFLDRGLRNAALDICSRNRLDSLAARVAFVSGSLDAPVDAGYTLASRSAHLSLAGYDVLLAADCPSVEAFLAKRESTGQFFVILGRPLDPDQASRIPGSPTLIGHLRRSAERDYTLGRYGDKAIYELSRQGTWRLRLKPLT